MSSLKAKLSSTSTWIYGLLFIAVILSLLPLWDLPILGGDDPGLALERKIRGSIAKSAWIQARAQGRFYYLVPWGLTQIPYIWESFVPLNLIRMASNVLVYLTLFGLLRSLWGQAFALLASFIGLGLFNYYGGEFNSYHSTPLWFALAAAFLFISLWAFNEACRRGHSFALAFGVYLLCLLFYEAMLLYAPTFLLLYFSHRYRSEVPIHRQLLPALLALRGLALVVFVYLACYASFRMYYPSAYEGAKELHFISLGRALKTIVQFSVTGVYLWPPFRQAQDFWLAGAMLGTVIVAGAWLVLRHHATALGNALSARPFFLTILGVGYAALAPNILYGLVDKYHVWSDTDPYYIGSYLASFSMVTLVTLLGLKIWTNLARVRSGGWLRVLLISGVFVATVGNASNALRIFAQHRAGAYRWPLVREVFAKAKDQLVGSPVVCTQTLVPRNDAFNIYNYWSVYIFQSLGISLTVRLKELESPECAWIVTYTVSEQKARLELSKVGGTPSFAHEIQR